MNRYIKKFALLIPLVKTYYRNAEELRKQNDELRRQNEQMKLNYEMRHGRDLYNLQHLNKIFEDNVNLLWSGCTKRKQWHCTNPFSRIGIDGSGSVYTCCKNYLKFDYSIGNAFTNSLDEIWNSDIAKKLRYSVSNGNFEYCSEQYCSALREPSDFPDIMISRNASPFTKHDRWQDYSLGVMPKKISLACDLSCNLRCASCRNHVISNSDEKNKQIASMLENFVRPALRDCVLLASCGGGEFFASKPLISFYQSLSKEEFPMLRLDILTNGTLFTPERWEKLNNLKGMVNRIQVSIDAASKTVYEKLRRGGCWESLCGNMEYISSLKISNKIRSLAMSFVVQKENFRQMRDFVLLARQWRADTVFFRRLRNLRTYTYASYIESDVFSIENPLYNEATQILSVLKQESGIRIFENCLNPDQSVEDEI